MDIEEWLDMYHYGLKFGMKETDYDSFLHWYYTQRNHLTMDDAYIKWNTLQDTWTWKIRQTRTPRIERDPKAR